MYYVFAQSFLFSQRLVSYEVDDDGFSSLPLILLLFLLSFLFRQQLFKGCGDFPRSVQHSILRLAYSELS